MTEHHALTHEVFAFIYILIYFEFSKTIDNKDR